LKKELLMTLTKKITGALLGGAMTMAVAVGPAEAQTRQDGLVNVSVGDVTILQDVNIAAAVDVVAQLCGIDLDVLANVTILSAAATAVDNTSRNSTVCRTEDGKVRFTQN
jgi:uncharacterized protein with ACT and thioredoxin-like domain